MEQAGYGARLPAPEPDPDESDEETRDLRHGLLVSTALSVPVVAMAIVPAWQFTYWQWLSLTLGAAGSSTVPPR